MASYTFYPKDSRVKNLSCTVWDHNGDWELFEGLNSVAHSTGRTGSTNPRKRLSRDEMQRIAEDKFNRYQIGKL